MGETLEMLKIAADLSAAGAILIAMVLLLKHFRGHDRALIKIIEEQRTSFLHTIQNHTDHQTQAVDALKESTNDLKGSINSLKEFLTTWLAARKD